MTPLLSTVTEWYCPTCGQTDQTRNTGPHTRFHTCPRLRYLSAPMVPRGTSAKVELHEREDYVGNEAVQLDPERKRPVMSITTTRADGSNDVVVFAAAANARGTA